MNSLEIFCYTAHLLLSISWFLITFRKMLTQPCEKGFKKIGEERWGGGRVGTQKHLSIEHAKTTLYTLKCSEEGEVSRHSCSVWYLSEVSRHNYLGVLQYCRLIQTFLEVSRNIWKCSGTPRTKYRNHTFDRMCNKIQICFCIMTAYLLFTKVVLDVLWKNTAKLPPQLSYPNHSVISGV